MPKVWRVAHDYYRGRCRNGERGLSVALGVRCTSIKQLFPKYAVTADALYSLCNISCVSFRPSFVSLGCRISC